MKRTVLTTAGLCLFAVLGLGLPGCETTTQRSGGTSSAVTGAGTGSTPGTGTGTASVNRPRVAVEAPADLHDIAGYLLRYRVLHQQLPPTLSVLRDEGFMPAEGFVGLENYAYQPEGLGQLADGRTIFVVDTAIRVEGHAWCVLAVPSGNPRTASLLVSLVSMADLQAAARRGR